MLLLVRLQQVMRDHRIEQRTLHFHTVLGQHAYVVLGVLRHFADGFVLKQRLENVHDALGFRTPFRHGDVVAFMRLPAEGKTDKLRGAFVSAGGLRIEAEARLLPQLCSKHVQCLVRIGEEVPVRHRVDVRKFGQLHIAIRIH